MSYCSQCGSKVGYSNTELEMKKRVRAISKPKRKLTAWQKFVKSNSKKTMYKYANGKLKLKKMGIAYRKKNK